MDTTISKRNQARKEKGEKMIDDLIDLRGNVSYEEHSHKMLWMYVLGFLYGVTLSIGLMYLALSVMP
jgi:hypothetical protein